MFCTINNTTHLYITVNDTFFGIVLMGMHRYVLRTDITLKVSTFLYRTTLDNAITWLYNVFLLLVIFQLSSTDKTVYIKYSFGIWENTKKKLIHNNILHKTGFDCFYSVENRNIYLLNDFLKTSNVTLLKYHTNK